MASTGRTLFSTRRSRYTFSRKEGERSFSSLRVPDLLTSMAGQMRCSASSRSSTSSMLPVPLNSSKITWSIREPVSIRAVATMVSEPPSSTFRAAPKKAFGLSRVRESIPPESVRPPPRWSRL